MSFYSHVNIRSTSTTSGTTTLVPNRTLLDVLKMSRNCPFILSSTRILGVRTTTGTTPTTTTTR